MDDDDIFRGNRKRGRRLFDEFFNDEFFGLSDDMRRMEERMARIFEEAKKAETEGEPKSFVYGFSMKTGPDGKPSIEEFGNIPRNDEPKHLDEIEPLVDVIEEDDIVKVIAEVPGVEKEDINIEAEAYEVTLKVDTPKRKYHKIIKLPAEVRTDGTQASYKNGILEITLKKIEKRKPSKTRIQVE